MTRNRFYFKTTTHTYVLPIVSFKMILWIDTIEKPTLETRMNIDFGIQRYEKLSEGM